MVGWGFVHSKKKAANWFVKETHLNYDIDYDRYSDLRGTENVHPNVAWGASHKRGTTLSSFSSSSLEKSDENGVVSERRWVKVVSHKRKAKEAVLVLTEVVGKKLQLKLRDEEIGSTAETAEHSRRSQ